MLLSIIYKISFDYIILFNEVPPTLDWKLEEAEKKRKVHFQFHIFYAAVNYL